MANYIIGADTRFDDDDFDFIRSYLDYEGYRETQRILAGVFEDAGLRIYSADDYGFDAWKNNGRARSNGRESNESSESRKTDRGSSQGNLNSFYAEAIRKGHPQRAREYLKQYAVQAGYTESQIKKMPTTVYDNSGNLVSLHDRFSDVQKYSSQKDYAPKFYSKMGQVVDGINQNKFGASSVVNMLRGKGVKAEEIKWSGIEQWLDGKKSVTKAEAISMMDAARQIDNNSEGLDAIAEKGREQSSVKWDEYKRDGGENYRELLFKLPGADNTNTSMQAHWKDSGVLAHARIQDFETASRTMADLQGSYSDERAEIEKEFIGFVNTFLRQKNIPKEVLFRDIFSLFHIDMPTRE